MAGIVKDNTD